MHDVDIIYMWPDGTWCFSEDLEEYLKWKSNDYTEIPFTDEISDDFIMNRMLEIGVEHAHP